MSGFEIGFLILASSLGFFILVIGIGLLKSIFD